MREKIQDVFTCELHDFYGSRDVSGLAGECYRNNKHELAFSNYIEILNNDGMNVNEGEEGRVIVTNLHNYSMPIIRYEIGDMAIKSYSDCSCGNFLPILKKVTGRITDHFLLENGTVVPAEFFIHIIGVVGNKGLIKKFQVIQEDYKTIKILVVADKTMCDRETESIGNKIRKVMGENCVILWEYVQDIPKTPSGKYIYTKSLVWENGNC